MGIASFRRRSGFEALLLLRRRRRRVLAVKGGGGRYGRIPRQGRQQAARVGEHFGGEREREREEGEKRKNSRKSFLALRSSLKKRAKGEQRSEPLPHFHLLPSFLILPPHFFPSLFSTCPRPPRRPSTSTPDPSFARWSGARPRPRSSARACGSRCCYWSSRGAA